MIWIVFAHFIGDIALQSDWQAQNKGRYWYVMLSHCMIWSACVAVALQYAGMFNAYFDVPFLVIGHFLMDSWKCKKQKTPEAWKYIYPDQGWHFVQLLIAFFI